MHLHYSMFLFKRNFTSSGYTYVIHLHYSMFLFKQRFMLKEYNNKKNLHYSMFLFKPCNSKFIKNCFVYLHYSMFLFKLFLLLAFIIFLFIYITVCFYLNDDEYNEKLGGTDIYITVCFYLNSRFSMSNFDGIKFTLQYVSI